MTSDFSKAVMVSLNEHMAQTLLDGMTATIRAEKPDMDLQIRGLEMLVENLECLNAKVSEFMEEIRTEKENTFSFDELDLEGLECWEEEEPVQVARSVGLNGIRDIGGVMRVSSPVGCNKVAKRIKIASRRLTTLCEEEFPGRLSFETITGSSSSSMKSKSSISTESITIKVDMPNTPPSSTMEIISSGSATATPSPPAFRPIDPKKIPKRKPVPMPQLEIPQKGSCSGTSKAFRRKEVPKRMYEQAGSDISTTTVNTINTVQTNTTNTSLNTNIQTGFNKSMESIWTPPVTDEECSPIGGRGEGIRNVAMAIAAATAAASAPAASTSIYQPKPRRVKSKQLKISIPRKGSGGKGSAGSSSGEKERACRETKPERPFGKLLRTPTSASAGSAIFQKRALEELDKAIATVRFNYSASDKGVKRMDSGREKRKSIYVVNNNSSIGCSSSKKKLSFRRRRKRYESGIPRCDSPVLGSFDVVFAQKR